MSETNKFVEWLDGEIARLEKQTKRWYRSNSLIYCLCEFASKAALEQKLTHYRKVREKYKELEEK